MTTQVVVVSAGLSQPSSTRLLADRLADAVRSSFAPAAVDVEVVELREHARDLTNQLLTGVPSPTLAALQDRLRTSDALVAVTPIFSASYSGLFKMFFDVVEPDSLHGKPTVIAATAGSARHSLALEHALRPLFSYLRAVVVPTAVFAATEDWASSGELELRVQRAADELAAVVGRTPVRAAPTTDFVPFDQLLPRPTSR